MVLCVTMLYTEVLAAEVTKYGCELFMHTVTEGAAEESASLAALCLLVSKEVCLEHCSS